MRFSARLLLVFFLAFGLQAGIVTSAASGIKLGALKSLCATTLLDEQSGEGEAMAPETPWPSCKSMTTPLDAEFVPPLREAGTQAKFAPDHARGLWRTLAIDEPPKRFPITS